jgi:hypothetical protein
MMHRARNLLSRFYGRMLFALPVFVTLLVEA